MAFQASCLSSGRHILGISFDAVEENKSFAERNQFHYPLLSDSRHTTGSAYGAVEKKTDDYAKRVSYLIGVSDLEDLGGEGIEPPTSCV